MWPHSKVSLLYSPVEMPNQSFKLQNNGDDNDKDNDNDNDYSNSEHNVT